MSPLNQTYILKNVLMPKNLLMSRKRSVLFGSALGFGVFVDEIGRSTILIESFAVT